MKGSWWTGGALCVLALSLATGWAQQPPANQQPPLPEGQFMPPVHPVPRPQPPADTLGATRKWLDVEYASGSPKHKLDIYLPNEGKGPFPTIIAVHGGGFDSGDKNSGEVNPELHGILHGYAVVSVNYRLSSEATFPAAVYDVKAAIRFLRAHASKYSLDPKRFALWGDSAGGNIASVAATSAEVKGMTDLSMGNAKESSAVQATVDFFGPTDMADMDAAFARAGVKRHMAHDPALSSESRYMGVQVTADRARVKRADPITYITPKTCPFFIANGANDATVPPSQDADFAAALEKAIGKGKVVHLVLDGVGHGGEVFNTPKVLDPTFAFLDKYLK